MSSHSLSISLYSTVCIVDVLYWEGKSFCLLWTWNGLHDYGDCLERYLFREDCYVFARVARMFSIPFFDIFENCFVKFLQINKFLFKDLVQLQVNLQHSSSVNLLLLLSNSAIWLWSTNKPPYCSCFYVSRELTHSSSSLILYPGVGL